MTKLGISLCAVVSLLALSGCGDDSRKNLFEAQVCIDEILVTPTSTKTQLDSKVNACMEKISGQNTRESYVLRCSGDFIRQGFAESTIYQAVTALGKDKKDGDEDPTGEILTLLAFDTPAEANTAVTNCGLAESEGLRDLADLANLATIMNDIAGNGSIDDLIENYDPTEDASMTNEQKVQLANAVIASQGSICSADKGTGKDSETCENINGAIAANGSETDAEKIALIDQFMANSKSGDD